MRYMYYIMAVNSTLFTFSTFDLLLSVLNYSFMEL